MARRRHSSFQSMAINLDCMAIASGSVEIAYEPLPDSAVDKLPSKVRSELLSMYDSIEENAEEQIIRLTELINRYPQVNPFRNHLIICYRTLGQDEKARDWAERLVACRPGYLFGKLVLADIYVNDFEFERAGKLLGGSIKSLIQCDPRRNAFHVSEARYFYFVLGKFSMFEEDHDTARECLKMIKAVSGRSSEFKTLKKMLSTRGRISIQLMLKERRKCAA